MLIDIEVKTCSRQCDQSGKVLEPGEVYFSVLVTQQLETVRLDYCAEAWPGPPEECLGWWRSSVPQKNEKPKLAPAEVMLNLFESLAEKPSETQFRYVLGLLLVRRRILRKEDTRRDDGQEVLVLHASRRDASYELIVDEPNAEQSEAIQQQMINLLYGDSDCPPTTSVTEAA